MPTLEDILHRCDRIEQLLAQLVAQPAPKRYYSTDEVAKLLRRDRFTIREWARRGRIHAEKQQTGRGPFRSWVISAAEVERIQREGLLPLPPVGARR